MNYIQLINNYWKMREQGIVSAPEGDLYLYLCHISNTLGWKNPFNHSTNLICAILGVSRNGLVNRRNKLKQVGLIDFKEGSTKGKSAVYKLLCISNDTQHNTQCDTQHDTHLDTQCDTQSDTIHKTKTKTKQNISSSACESQNLKADDENENAEFAGVKPSEVLKAHFAEKYKLAAKNHGVPIEEIETQLQKFDNHNENTVFNNPQHVFNNWNSVWCGNYFKLSQPKLKFEKQAEQPKQGKFSKLMTALQNIELE